MNAEETLSPEEHAKLEITLPTALELCRLGLATMIDIRQSFEIEMKGAIPDTCLLYTSDAADDLLCVDLGGRRIIKKKKNKKK